MIEACSLCGGDCLEILDLGVQNLANNLTKDQDDVYAEYKLSLVICQVCGVQQLDGVVDPSLMFENYLWVTGTSQSTLLYLDQLAHFCAAYKGVNATVLEIASNDGSFLKCLAKNGWIVKGVDPAKNIADIANFDGIQTIPCFFGNDYRSYNPKEINSYDLIVARNVLPHAPNVSEILAVSHSLLRGSGKFVVEFHDANQLYHENQIDYIYHEHKYYFTYNSFVNLAIRHGYKVCDYMRSPISAGSHVIVFEKTEINALVPNVGQSEVARYVKRGLQNACNNFIERISKTIDYHDGPVFGFGASARASTLANLIDDTSGKKISSMIDNSTHKQGFYFSRHRILIESPESITSPKGNELILVFAWNFFNEIEEQLLDLGFLNSRIVNVKRFLN